MADESTTSKRKWPRRVRTVVLCLIAGAIINVLLAWSLACTASRLDRRGATQIWAEATAEFDFWIVTTYERFGYRHYESQWWDLGASYPNREFKRGNPGALLPSWMRDCRPGSTTNGVHARIGHAFGFPLVCLWWEESGDAPAYSTAVGVEPRGAHIRMGEMLDSAPPNPTTIRVPRVLPVRAIFPEILWNTLIYSFVALIAFHGVCRVRQSKRRHRGLCPSCAYDLRGAKHDVCPECGK